MTYIIEEGGAPSSDTTVYGERKAIYRLDEARINDHVTLDGNMLYIDKPLDTKTVNDLIKEYYNYHHAGS